MPPSKIRFVTLCQQLLALAVVLAVLTPAASVISLDVAHEGPDATGADVPVSDISAALRAYTRELGRTSRVPDHPVEPSVAEYPLTPSRSTGRVSRTKADAVASARSVTSAAEPVAGYGAVGVTWAPGTVVPEADLRVQVRSRTAGAWSGWMDVEYDAEHGPTPGSAEARHARPGTDALLVGDVDDVQVKVTTKRRPLPTGLRLAVVDPGAEGRTSTQGPALQTSAGEKQEPQAEGDLALSAATYTPKPEIYSRAQWGADESIRDAGSLHYFEVHAGFVHHTVNANDYSRDEVPGIIRSIYAYHTKSRGWSDIGYNYLVDRFGRIWEGRFGGIDRPVVGAHTLDYNDYAFAMSAIGNYETKQPTGAMVEAYGALFAWKLSLHGVDASSPSQVVGARSFPAINGHRDAASTACPGRYLYARLGDIRRLAAEAQRGWAGRELESDLVGTDHPDLVVRRAGDGQAFVVPTGGLTAFGGSSTAAAGLPSRSVAVVSPDLTGDGQADLLVRLADGTAQVRPGTGAGTFGAPTGAVLKRFADHTLLTAVGDVNGDKRHDLVGRRTDDRRLDVFLGRGNGTFKVRHLATSWGGYNLVAAVGDLTGDGRDDVVARDRSGRLWLHAGGRRGELGTRTAVAGSFGGYSAITGYGDVTGDGRADLVLRRKAGKAAYVLPARGDGTFGHVLGPVAGLMRLGTLVGAAQVAGDGTADLVFRAGGSLVLRTNRGTTETRAPVATGIDASGAVALFNAGDWDRDGFGDVITQNRKGALHLRRGDGNGGFAAPVRIGTGFSKVHLLAAAGDVTGDGWPDLMGQPRGGDIRIYPGAGLSGLAPSYVAHRAIKAGRQVAVGRWNADGAPDSLFVRGAKPLLYAGNGPGGLTGRARALNLDLTPYDWVVGVSDIGVVGHADLVVREKATGYLWLIPGTATGFGKRRFLAEGMGGYDLAG
jgi:N-acetylmuramoyl-L-alanine amidase-like protein/VCBS repeat protein